MLVVTLFDGEFVQIGESIRVVIDRCVDDRKSTRLGIEAPREVKVLREELVARADPTHK